jgi:hypothetical protein
LKEKGAGIEGLLHFMASWFRRSGMKKERRVLSMEKSIQRIITREGVVEDTVALLADSSLVLPLNI